MVRALSGSKAPLSCVWDEERSYTADSLPRNSSCGCFSRWKALDFHAVKSKRIYHADSRNQSCVWNLYKRTFGANNQLATRIICTKRALHHGRLIERVWLYNDRLLSKVGA